MTLEWPEGMTVSELLRDCAKNVGAFNYPITNLYYQFFKVYNVSAEDEQALFLMLADQIEKELKQARIVSWPSYIEAPADEDGKLWAIGDCVVVEGKEGCIKSIIHLLNKWYTNVEFKDGAEKNVFLDECKRPKEDSLNAVFNDMLQDYRFVGSSYIRRIADLLTKSEQEV